ncbi:hypothetical protein PR001_g24662 [Phytophthora rubi]|nr:hypothetical protein PR001_g24662 [Phytophthora rubi]
MLPTYVGLLEPLQLTLQSARDNHRPLFVLHVQRRVNCRQSPTSSSATSWSFPRPFADFEALHKRLTLALQHGHFCNAGCPWLFSFLTSEFPKKHIFQRNSSPRTVEGRRAKLLELLTSTLEFLLDRKNHACSVATTNVAKLLAQFLYGEDAVSQYIFESYSETETTSTNNTSQSKSIGALACDVKSDSGKGLGFNVSPGNAGGGSRRRSSVYATVLRCGHQFHDECIVPVLNKTLRCPTCHRLEIE